MSAPVVDVGMPAHGRPRFLGEAIESVLAQTHAELRLTVLDDTTDAEIESVVDRFRSDQRVVYRRVEPTSATGAMSALIAAADAPYFAFLHDDDRWEAEVLERRVSFLEAHPECVYVFSGHVDINAEGRINARAPAPYPAGVIPRAEIVRELQRRAVVDVMHSVLVRRRALEQAGPWLHPEIPRVFDWELWLRLALVGPVGSLEVEDVQYRAHEEQMSGAPGMAQDFADLARISDALVLERAPELRLGEDERRAKLARLAISAALDALTIDETELARRKLREALATDRRTTVGDRRFYAALVGVGFGRPGRRGAAALRAAIYRRRHDRRMAR